MKGTAGMETIKLSVSVQNNKIPLLYQNSNK